MARSHYRGTVYGNQPTGAKPLPGAAIRLFHPDTGAPWALPVYPDPVNGTPYSLPIYTTIDGELELWADEPARVACTVTHQAYYGVGEVIEIRPDPETQATDEDLEESVEDHEAKEDPHDQYLTEPEGNLLYKPIGYEPDLTDYYTRDEADDEFLDQDEADLRYEQLSRKGMPNGYVPLDLGGLVPNQYLPPLAITETFVVTSEAEMLALPAQQGDVAVRLDTTENYILRVDPATVLANWTKLAASTTAGNTTVLRREEFTPAPLATTVTLAAPPTTVHAVSRNGVGQSQPAGHYSLSGLVLTFTDPFVLGERVAVVYEIGSSVPAPVNGYTKLESDARYEPIDTMYTKAESDAKYLTQALGDARYSLTGHLHTGTYLPVSHEPGVDPHNQYLNNTRGDARYSVLAHNHGGAYLDPATADATYVNVAGDTMSGALTLQGAAATTNVLQTKLAADTQPRFRVDASGFLEWGSGGTQAPDTSIKRTATDQLTFDADLLPTPSGSKDLGTATAQWRDVQASRNVIIGATTSTLQIGGASSAASGTVRLRNASLIAWRNAASSADLSLAVDASDRLAYSGSTLMLGGDTTLQRTGAGALRADTHLGVGVNPESDLSATQPTIRLGYLGVIDSPTAAQGLNLRENTKVTAGGVRAIAAAAASFINIQNGSIGMYTAPAVAAGAAQAFSPRATINTTGTLTLTPDAGQNALAWGASGRIRSDASGHVYFEGHPGQVYVTPGNFFGPSADNYAACGWSNFRWTVVYAVAGAINTSSAAVKEGITPLSPAECYQAAKDVRWYEYAYLPPVYQEPDLVEGETKEAGEARLTESRTAHAKMLVETAPARHQRGFVFPTGDAKDEAGGTLPPVPDLFGLSDRQSTTPQADLATLGAALQELIRRFEIVEAKVS